MSKFGNTTSSKCLNNKFTNIPIHSDIFTKNRHWDSVRNNIDTIISNSRFAQNQEIHENEELVTECNELPVIYDCEDPLPTVEVEKVIEFIAEEIKAPPKEEPISVKPKKKFEFASVVLQYRNELARRKFKEISEEAQNNI